MSEFEEIEPGSPVRSGDWVDLARSASSSAASIEAGSERELHRELLVFGLDKNPYAMPVERVREIVRTRPLTDLPHSPLWLLGVMALRGEIVEVVDLRRRLGVRACESDRSSRIIVLHGDASSVTGVLVDSVSGVFEAAEESILPTEEFESGAVVEMCRRGDEFVSILEVDRVLGFADA